MVKRIVCLANSRKKLGRCLAGRELVGEMPGAWIRPVSDRPSQEVSEDERQFEDGTDPRVLDIIDVPLRGHRPENYQQENWLLDPDQYWVKVGRASWDDLVALADNPETLWVNGHETYHGLNDRVPLDLAMKLRDSLKLIWVERVQLRVFRPSVDFGDSRRRIQARFRYAGTDYALRVTDPIIERRYLARPDGDYSLEECYLTVSLGEPYEGYCYKLVAAVIDQQT